MPYDSRTRLDPRPLLTADPATINQILPPDLAALTAPIVASRAMLDLGADWDGEGSPGYKENTWLRAIDFLIGNALGLWEELSVAVPPLKIGKGPGGSIDLHWRTPDRELLINIPPGQDSPADYYGDDQHGGHVVKGTLDPSGDNLWLLMWLTTV
jgi:hypothetical protein